MKFKDWLIVKGKNKLNFDVLSKIKEILIIWEFLFFMV